MNERLTYYVVDNFDLQQIYRDRLKSKGSDNMDENSCGKFKIDEIVDKLKEQFELSEEEQEYLLNQLRDFEEIK